MLYKKDIIADLHTHTIASKHAFSTVKENVEAAKKKNLKYLAITEHFYQNGDEIECKNEIARMCYTKNLIQSPSMHIISGVELNLKHKTEVLEIDKIYKNVLWRLVGLHSWYVDIPNTKVKDIPELFEKSLNGNKYVTPTAFAHIERELTDCKGGKDMKKIKNALSDIVDIAVANNIVLEINEGSFHRDNDIVTEEMMFWMTLAKERNVIFSIGSDAHYCDDIGIFDKSIKLINTIGISKNRIINANPDMLEDLIAK